MKPARASQPNRLSAFEMQVLRTIRKYRMIESGDRILAAVSGGADSTALLLCLHRLSSRLKVTLTAAHLNHKLRGLESNADEEAVRELCSKFDIPLAVDALSTHQAAAILKGNLEEKARSARYSFLLRAGLQAGANKIALGHSKNDQAETVLLHFMRGSGLAGLSAIHPVVNHTLIRPLLETHRCDIIEYLLNHGVPYREDSSNRDLRFRRNRIRHECLPYLERHFNPRIIQTLARQAELARESSALLDRIGDREFETMKVILPSGAAVPAFSLTVLDPALAKGVIRSALRQQRGSLKGITSKHIDSLLRLCSSQRGRRKLVLPGGFTVRRESENLIFGEGAPPAAAGFEYPLDIPGKRAVAEAGIEFSAEISVPQEPPSRESRAYFDPAAVPGELQLRTRRAGDRYGGPGRRKVKKMLSDAHIDVSARDRFPLLCMGEVVIWMPGYEPAKSFKAKDLKEKCLIVTVRKMSSYE